MIIQVTDADIRIGSRVLCGWGPLAIAIRRAIGMTRKVEVGLSDVLIDGRPHTLPGIAIAFQREFDTRQPVQPIEFEFDYKETA